MVMLTPSHDQILLLLLRFNFVHHHMNNKHVAKVVAGQKKNTHTMGEEYCILRKWFSCATVVRCWQKTKKVPCHTIEVETISCSYYIGLQFLLLVVIQLLLLLLFFKACHLTFWPSKSVIFLPLLLLVLSPTVISYLSLCTILCCVKN